MTQEICDRCKKVLPSGISSATSPISFNDDGSVSSAPNGNRVKITIETIKSGSLGVGGGFSTISRSGEFCGECSQEPIPNLFPN